MVSATAYGRSWCASSSARAVPARKHPSIARRTLPPAGVPASPEANARMTAPPCHDVDGVREAYARPRGWHELLARWTRRPRCHGPPPRPENGALTVVPSIPGTVSRSRARLALALLDLPAHLRPGTILTHDRRVCAALGAQAGITAEPAAPAAPKPPAAAAAPIEKGGPGRARGTALPVVSLTLRARRQTQDRSRGHTIARPLSSARCGALPPAWENGTRALGRATTDRVTCSPSPARHAATRPHGGAHAHATRAVRSVLIEGIDAPALHLLRLAASDRRGRGAGALPYSHFPPLRPAGSSSCTSMSCSSSRAHGSTSTNRRSRSGGCAAFGAGVSVPVRRTLRFPVLPNAARFAVMTSPAPPRCSIIAVARPPGYAGRRASVGRGNERVWRLAAADAAGQRRARARGGVRRDRGQGHRAGRAAVGEGRRGGHAAGGQGDAGIPGPVHRAAGRAAGGARLAPGHAALGLPGPSAPGGGARRRAANGAGPGRDGRCAPVRVRPPLRGPA